MISFIKNSLLPGSLLIFSLLASITVHAAGLLTPVNSGLPELEIRSHKVTVIIEDGFATTTVEQVFHNPHQQDLEALYSFPIPDHAAVGEFVFWVDGKPVIGEVVEKEQAREIYQKEKLAGRQVAVTEQNDYKTFEISVTPVKAGQDVRIKLVYIQTTPLDSGIGRYVYPLEEGGVDEEQLAFWNNNDTVTDQFSFNLQIKSSWPVKGVRVPHQSDAQISQQNERLWDVRINNMTGTAASESTQAHIMTTADSNTDVKLEQAVNAMPHSGKLNKDIVVYWRLADNLPGAVEMITYKPDTHSRGTFMMTLTPGIDLKPVSEGKDWIFILDISGSMQGKYQTLAEGVKQALKKMTSKDRIRVILFNNQARELTAGYTSASRENINQIIQKVAAIQPNGGTNVYDSLNMAIKKLDSDRTSAIILVTDGVANVGITEQKKFIELIKTRDVRLFTFIMGNSANRPLLENLTKASHGFAINVSNSDDIVGRIMLAGSKVNFEAMHDINVKISGVKTADIQPAQPGSLYRGEQLVLIGHYWTDQDRQANVSFNTRISGEDKQYQTRFIFPAQTAEYPEIERLWAYHTINTLQSQIDNFGEDADYKDNKQAIIDIAREFSLVTNYTSMIVLEEQQFKTYNVARNNKQRVNTENQARTRRAQQSPASRRMDKNQPMFSDKRSYVGGNGGGALDLWGLLLLLPLLMFFKKPLLQN